MRRLGIWMLIVGAAAIAGGAMSWKPWRAYLEQRQIAHGQESEMRESESKRAKLAKEKAALESGAGREALAREHGFKKPGEVPIEGR